MNFLQEQNFVQFVRRNQMKITRREFLTVASSMAGLLGLKATGLMDLQKAFAGSGDPSVIWLQGQSCTGCSVSLLNSIYFATIDELLLNTINLEYHPNLMASAGDFAINAAQVARPSNGELMDLQGEWLQKGPGLSNDLNSDSNVNFVDFGALARRGYILVVEGAIPTGANGDYCGVANGLTMVDAMRRFAPSATHIVAVGTCATYGGIAAARPNPTGALGVKDALTYIGVSKPVVNIPGCPIHPDWLVGTLIDVLTGATLSLDSNGRPTKYYGAIVHNNCQYLSSFNSYYSSELSHANNRSCLSCHSNSDSDIRGAKVLGATGCLFALGCKGRQTYCDCSTRKWNSAAKSQNGINWCVGAGSPCYGCTQPNFPDGMSPFYTLGGGGV